MSKVALAIAAVLYVFAVPPALAGGTAFFGPEFFGATKATVSSRPESQYLRPAIPESQYLDRTRQNECLEVDIRLNDMFHETEDGLWYTSLEFMDMDAYSKISVLTGEFRLPRGCLTYVERLDRGRPDVLIMSPSGDYVLTDDPDLPMVQWQHTRHYGLLYYKVVLPNSDAVVGIER